MPIERIQILNEKTGQKFRVMFNPEEYSLNKDNNYASQAIPGLQSPLLQFVHTPPTVTPRCPSLRHRRSPPGRANTTFVEF